jgi:sporulation protein YlmC with PRC-barrel domain
MGPQLERTTVRAIGVDRHERMLAHTRVATTLIAAVALFVLLLIAYSAPVRSQAVRLVTVDVNVVGQGYRASKLMGTSVTNEKNEKIGTLSDLVVARDRSLLAVLEVGGFLGMGAHLVAVPYETLVINDEGRDIRLPGASKDELKKLAEVRFRG